MTTSSHKLEQLIDDALNSYIDWSPEHEALIKQVKSLEEFDAVMKRLVPMYNK